MCLSKVTDMNPRKSGTGWKCFDEQASEPERGLFAASTRTSHKFRVGKWKRDRAKGEISIFRGVSYPKGFHIFKYKKDAKQWHRHFDVVRKVEYDDAVCSGTQNLILVTGVRPAPVIVARKVRIIPEEGEDAT